MKFRLIISAVVVFTLLGILLSMSGQLFWPKYEQENKQSATVVFSQPQERSLKDMLIDAKRYSTHTFPEQKERCEFPFHDYHFPEKETLLELTFSEDCRVDAPAYARHCTPLVRIPPLFPKGAVKSGHCKIRYEVNAKGETQNIIVSDCTDKMFNRPSLKAVQKWRHYLKIVDGEAVPFKAKPTTITYRLHDEHGVLIPE